MAAATSSEKKIGFILCLICRCFVAKRILKLLSIFVFFVFILVDAFSGSIKTKKSQKIFLP